MSEIKIIKDYWRATGNIKYEIPYKNDQLHGIVKWWYDNSQPECKMSYQNGQHHGIQKFWNKNGQLETKKYYLYNIEVSEEEYRKHELTKKLAGLNEDEKNILA